MLNPWCKMSRLFMGNLMECKSTNFCNKYHFIITKFVASGLFHSYLKPFSYWNMSWILYEMFFDYSPIFIMFNDIYQNADKSKFILATVHCFDESLSVISPDCKVFSCAFLFDLSFIKFVFIYCFVKRSTVKTKECITRYIWLYKFSIW